MPNVSAIRRRLKYSVIAGGALAFGAFLVVRHPLLAKLVVGESFALRRAPDDRILADGQVIRGARCFRSRELIGHVPADRLALWLSDPTALDGRVILLVDRKWRTLSVPNSTSNDFRMYGPYLLQAESATMGAEFGSAKMDGSHVDVVVGQHTTGFRMPNSDFVPASLKGKWIETHVSRTD